MDGSSTDVNLDADLQGIRNGAWRVRLIHHASILKIMHQKVDINDWHQASVQDDCKPYMNPNIQQNRNPGIRAAFGFGEVTNTGWVNTALLVDEFTTYLKSKEKLMPSV